MSAAPIERDPVRPLDLVEVVVLLATTGLAVAGAVSMALAQQQVFSTAAAVLLGVAGTAVLVGVALRLGGRPTVDVSAVDAGLLLGVVALAAVLFFPGFPYAFADKDPGVYVTHGLAIERTGAIDVPDPTWELALETDADVTMLAGFRFPGFSAVSATTSSSSFFHFLPGLFATAFGLGGTAAVFNLTPFVALIATLAVAAATRRAFGVPAAVVTTILLAANMMQVWQAKTPSTEIYTQALLFGAIVGALVAVQTGWPGAAFLSGFVLTSTFLLRPDALLFLGFGAGLVAVAIALDRADARVWAGLAGAAVLLPYAWLNAFRIESHYVSANGVPGGWKITSVFVVLFIAAFVGRELHRRTRLVEQAGRLVRRVPAQAAGAALLVGLVAVGVLVWNRLTWFGPDVGLQGTKPYNTLSERNMHWLTEFVTMPGLLLGLAGVAVVSLRKRWTLVHWIVLTPGLALLPLYLYDARIAPRLMWWVRRFVPSVLPILMVLAGVAIAALWTRRHPAGRVVAVVLGALVALSYLSMSLPLRDHREFAGTYDIAERIATATDGAGMVLYDYPAPGVLQALRNTPAVVTLAMGRPGTYVPQEIDSNEGDLFVEWDDVVDGPIYLVTREGELREGFDPWSFELVEEFDVGVPFWEESAGARPDESRIADEPIHVWRYLGPA